MLGSFKKVGMPGTRRPGRDAFPALLPTQQGRPRAWEVVVGRTDPGRQTAAAPATPELLLRAAQSLRSRLHALTPLQLLLAGYLFIVLLVAALLSLPMSSAQGRSQPFLDSLFVATSGISTTGLTPVDIGSTYSLFGQLVLLLDFQIGGLGYMAFFAFIAHLLKRELSLTTAMVATESLAGSTLGDVKTFFRTVVTYTFVFEFAGAVLLAVIWMHDFPISRAVYLGVFHSVSAFCTAGFGLFPDNLISYQGNVALNLVINVVSLAGGISFFVLQDASVYCRNAARRKHPRSLSVHSKMAITVTALVLLAGTAVLLVSENWPASVGWGKRLLIASFQAVSASTTDGFNTLDIGAMSATGLLMIMVLMFIGASPGSTGGGVKTTTFGVLSASLWSFLRGKRDINVFRRKVPEEVAGKSFAIFLLFLGVLMIDALVMSRTEQASFLQLLFEIVSALGNTGLSAGITAGLSAAGKLLLIATMFIGRVGPLAIGFALFGRAEPEVFQYAEEEVFVG